MIRNASPPFAAGPLVGGIAPILLAFVYTRALGADGYGRLEVAAAAATAALHLGLLGADGAVAAALHAAPAQTRPSIVTSALIGPAVASVGAGVLAAFAVALLVPTEPALWPAVMASVIGVTVFTAAMAAVRQLRRPLRFLAAHIAAGAAWLAGGVVLVAALGLGIAGVFAASAIAMGVGSLVAIHGLRDMLVPAGWQSEVRAVLRLGLPLVPAGLAIWSLALVDRFILASFVAPSDLGAYGAAARLASGMGLIVAIATIGWSPLVLAAPHDDVPRLVGWGLGAFAPFAGILVIAAAVVGDPAVRLFAGADFAAGGEVVWLLVAATASYGVYLVTMVGYLARGATRSLAVITGLSALINLVVTLALVPLLGIVGAGIASAVGYAGWAGFALAIGARRGLIHVPRSLGSTVLLVIVAGVAVRGPLPDPVGWFVAVLAAGLLITLVRAPLLQLRLYRADAWGE